MCHRGLRSAAIREAYARRTELCKQAFDTIPLQPMNHVTVNVHTVSFRRARTLRGDVGESVVTSRPVTARGAELLTGTRAGGRGMSGAVAMGLPIRLRLPSFGITAPGDTSTGGHLARRGSTQRTATARTPDSRCGRRGALCSAKPWRGRAIVTRAQRNCARRRACARGAALRVARCAHTAGGAVRSDASSSDRQSADANASARLIRCCRSRRSSPPLVPNTAVPACVLNRVGISDEVRRWSRPLLLAARARSHAHSPTAFAVRLQTRFLVRPVA